MREPHITHTLVQAILTQEQLELPTQRPIHLSMLVKIRCRGECATFAVHKEQFTWADADEYTDRVAASETSCQVDFHTRLNETYFSRCL